MFADNFAFYKGYTIPHLKTVEEYRNAIESLPLTDTPDVFGLHPNADISCQTKESQKMLGAYAPHIFVPTCTSLNLLSRNYHVHSTKRQQRRIGRNS